MTNEGMFKLGNKLISREMLNQTKDCILQDIFDKAFTDQKIRLGNMWYRAIDKERTKLLKQIVKIIKEDYVGYANGEKFVYQSDILRKINKLK